MQTMLVFAQTVTYDSEGCNKELLTSMCVTSTLNHKKII